MSTAFVAPPPPLYRLSPMTFPLPPLPNVYLPCRRTHELCRILQQRPYRNRRQQRARLRVSHRSSVFAVSNSSAALSFIFFLVLSDFVVRALGKKIPLFLWCLKLLPPYFAAGDRYICECTKVEFAALKCFLRRRLTENLQGHSSRRDDLVTWVLPEKSERTCSSNWI